MARVMDEIRDEVIGRKKKILVCLVAIVTIFSLLCFFKVKKSEEVEKPLYDQAFEDLIKNEGGYVNHPADPGGETKYGICKRYNPDIDIKNVTLEFAKQFYYEKFWLPMYEKINDRRIAFKLFDISVNIGKNRLRDLVNETLMDAVCYPDRTAVEELDEVVRAYEEDENIEQWESYVVEKINSTDGDLFLSIFKSKLINYYCERIYDNNKLHVFRHGWIKRAVK